jgi:hypothetical protein
VVTEGDVLRGYQSFCYLVEEGKARRLPIELGAGDRERVAVLRKQSRSGGQWGPFTGKEEIVQSNAKEVRDGQDVQVDRRAK